MDDNTDNTLDLTVQGVAVTDVLKYDAMITAVEAAAPKWTMVEDGEDATEAVSPAPSPALETTDAEPTDEVSVEQTQESILVPQAPSAPTVDAFPAPPTEPTDEVSVEQIQELIVVPQAEEQEDPDPDQEVSVEQKQEPIVVLQPEDQEPEQEPTSSPVAAVQKSMRRMSMKMKPVRPNKTTTTTKKTSAAKKTKARTKRRETFSSSSLATKKMRKKTSPKAAAAAPTSRGRTKERVRKKLSTTTHRRASSGSNYGTAKPKSIKTKSPKHSSSVPSYLRPTRSSSMSQERALKRKNDRRSLSQSRSKKTGFGGHTYQANKRTKKASSRSLTEPKAFRLSTSKGSKKSTMTTEDLELQKAQEAKNRMDKRRQLNEKSRTTADCATASSTSQPQPHRVAELTAPKEFVLSKSNRSVKQRQTLTSEELEMQRVNVELKRAKQLREKNKKTKVSALSSSRKNMIARSNKKLTEASSPKFHSRTRPKANYTQRKKDAKLASKKSIYGSRRPTAAGHGPVKAGKGKQKKIQTTKQLTKPSTPKFATDRRAKIYKEMHEAQENDGQNPPQVHQVHQSLAEQVMKMTNKVPERFHSKPKHHKPSSSSSSSSSSQLTEPVGPTFATDSRTSSRPRPKSTAEMEMEQMKQFQSKPFRAKPVDPRVMNSAGDLGVPRLPKKPLTKCESPKFRVDKRASIERNPHPSSEQEQHYKPFRAREIGEGVVQGFAGSSSYAGPKPLTEFAPFSLSSSQRVTKVEKKIPVYKPFKARPAPITTTATPSSVQSLKPKELTKPVTPKLESLRLHKEAQLLRKAQIAAERQAEAMMSSSFRAREIGQGVPAPNYTASTYQPRELTEMKPFNVSSDPVHTKASIKENQRKMKVENDKQRHFKARSIPTTHHQPFAVQKAAHVLCETNNIMLASDKRALKRAAFEQEAALRRSAAKQVEDEKQAQIIADYNAEIDAEIKAMQFHKPEYPMMHSAPTGIKQSEAVLCDPKSPFLHTASRIRASVGVE